MEIESNHYSLSNDHRWQAIRFGLDQLTTIQLARIVAHERAGGCMCCDTYNFDASTGLWCPLAIGLDVPALAMLEKNRQLNNTWAKSFITDVGRSTCSSFTLNPISGVPGTFYTTNRVRDIVTACEQLIAERTV